MVDFFAELISTSVVVLEAGGDWIGSTARLDWLGLRGGWIDSSLTQRCSYLLTPPHSLKLPWRLQHIAHVMRYTFLIEFRGCDVHRLLVLAYWAGNLVPLLYRAAGLRRPLPVRCVSVASPD